jgi:HDOD domain
VLKRTDSSSYPGRDLTTLDFPPFPHGFAPELPAVPILAETLLLLEIKAQELAVDLGEITQIVLSDPGAALQVLRLAGRDAEFAEGGPRRIEDYISGLGVRACVEAASSQRIVRGRQDAIAEVWEYSRDVAQSCRQIAEQLPDVNPDEAYLVGLLHRLGSLPELLGWNWPPCTIPDSAWVGLTLANSWRLPPCVVEFFRERCAPGDAVVWPNLVNAAHQSVRRAPLEWRSSARPRRRPPASNPVVAISRLAP